MALQAHDAQGPRQLVDVLPYHAGPNLSAPRNELVTRFLEHPAAPEWFFSLDTDMSFAPDLLERLLDVADEDERPIVGAVCFSVSPMGDTLDDKFSTSPPAAQGGS